MRATPPLAGAGGRAEGRSNTGELALRSQANSTNKNPCCFGNHENANVIIKTPHVFGIRQVGAGGRAEGRSYTGELALRSQANSTNKNP